MAAPVLCIGQSDCSAGSGIQADIKTVQAFGGYAATAVTAITVQNTQGIHDIHVLPAALVRQQIDVIAEDFRPAAIKTGMLATADIINAVGDFLDSIQESDVPVVIDPVMVNYTGRSFLDKEARDALKRRLLPHAKVLMPNLQEAEDLTGLKVQDPEELQHAAKMLRTLGADVVILKGGSLGSDTMFEVMADPNTIEVFQHPVIENKTTHGAGTALSAGMTIGLAQGMSARDAFVRVRDYVHDAIRNGKKVGAGCGPLNPCANGA